jgi:kynureninase
MNFQNTLQFAKALDSKDVLGKFRNEFHLPVINGKETLYFTGNSLGLQPKSVKTLINEELEDWAQWGVEGHFESRRPWFKYHEFLTEKAAKIVGAKPIEVVITHSLTTNLHLLMVSFYQPKGKRTKFLLEEKAFPSDNYAVESQVRFHGLEPSEHMVEIGPREGEHTIRHEDIIAKIDELGDELACVMIGGVNYYTGQLFDMKSITEKAHEVGAYCGFDLAHAAGNIAVQLHDWKVDFAAWCSYKYLNSSPGGVSGIFVHETHANKPELPRFAGWWGYDKETRFQMEPGFKPMPGAEGWQLSNAPVLGMAAHLASLNLFEEAGMDRLCEKRDSLTAYLEFVVNSVNDQVDVELEIITPKEKENRGAQLSILAHGMGKDLFDKITLEGVIADWREPNVIRMAPVPMYNSFEDVYLFGQVLLNTLK